MIRWRIHPGHFEAAGIRNAFQLSRAAGVSYETATRIFLHPQPPAERIDVRALEAVARVLRVAPLSLLEWSEDEEELEIA